MRPAKSKTYIIISLFLAILFFLHYAGYLSGVESGVRYLLKPISFKLNVWRIQFSDFFKRDDELKRNYQTYLVKSQEFEVSYVKLKVLETENAELKKILNFFQGSNYLKITTSVIGKNSDSLQKMIIIDAGETAGIRMDQPVIVGEGILVGIVSHVEKDTSIVRLLNDNQSKIAATILNRDQSLGVVEGGYGLSIKMNFIPRNEIILVGDKIITSGLEKNIPKGLLIGEVAVAQNESFQPFQQAILTTATDLSKLFIVSVLTENGV
ncbi:MAG: rod shape-determining protein MreC [Patescibacteria group bacterium]